MTLSEIEKITKEYALARKEVEARVQGYEEELEQVKKRHITGIKKSVTVAKVYQDKLYHAIDSSPELFVKPKTIVLYGIRIGFMKGKGEMRIEDPGHVVKLIKKYFPEQVETLIKITEYPVKSALAQLSVQDLKRLGVEVIETNDQVTIKPTDSEVDRLVEALLREEVREAA